VDRDRLSKIAAEQSGLFSRAQAYACGYSQKQVRHRLATGAWLRVLGGVFAVAGVRIGERQRDRAAQMAMRGAVLTGPSAARWYGIEISDSGTYLAVAPGANTRLVGVRLLRDPPTEADLRFVDGVALVSRGRAVFDCLRVLPDAEAIALLDRALQRRWISLDELTTRVRSFAARRGAPRLVRLVRTIAAGSRSEAERRAAALLRDAAIRGWTAYAPIYDEVGLMGGGDSVFARDRLVIELDGWAFHTTPDRFQRDRSRQNRLVPSGWTVLRFTWRDLADRPDYFVRTVRRVGRGTRSASA